MALLVITFSFFIALLLYVPSAESLKNYCLLAQAHERCGNIPAAIFRDFYLMQVAAIARSSATASSEFAFSL
jgi:hypothetical protein